MGLFDLFGKRIESLTDAQKDKILAKAKVLVEKEKYIAAWDLLTGNGRYCFDKIWGQYHAKEIDYLLLECEEYMDDAAYRARYYAKGSKENIIKDILLFKTKYELARGKYSFALSVLTGGSSMKFEKRWKDYRYEEASCWRAECEKNLKKEEDNANHSKAADKNTPPAAETTVPPKAVATSEPKPKQQGSAAAKRELTAEDFYQEGRKYDQFSSQGVSGKTSVFPPKEDTGEAFYWYQRAAEAGSLKGQTALALMYSCGFGCENNNQKAFFWYTQAAFNADYDKNTADDATTLAYESARHRLKTMMFEFSNGPEAIRKLVGNKAEDLIKEAEQQKEMDDWLHSVKLDPNEVQDFLDKIDQLNHKT